MCEEKLKSLFILAYIQLSDELLTSSFFERITTVFSLFAFDSRPSTQTTGKSGL